MIVEPLFIFNQPLVYMEVSCFVLFLIRKPRTENTRKIDTLLKNRGKKLQIIVKFIGDDRTTVLN